MGRGGEKKKSFSLQTTKCFLEKNEKKIKNNLPNAKRLSGGNTKQTLPAHVHINIL